MVTSFGSKAPGVEVTGVECRIEKAGIDQLKWKRSAEQTTIEVETVAISQTIDEQYLTSLFDINDSIVSSLLS